MSRLLKLILLPIILFSSPLFSDLQETESERHAHAIFILRQHGAIQKGTEEANENRYLFQRSFWDMFGSNHDTYITKEVAQIMQSNIEPLIEIDDSVLEYFDHGGTCSAMALDFLARYLDDCHDLNDPEVIIETVRSYAPYYIKNNTTFTSRQAAYNAIALRPEYENQINSDDDEFKRAKMQTLAQYHNITLTPAISSIRISKIAKEIIDELPVGAYLVRALSPNNYSKKKETYGHSMVLIKGEQHGIYYDNGDGAVNITGRVSDFVVKKLLDWQIPECRLYLATCAEGSIIHLSTETAY